MDASGRGASCVEALSRIRSGVGLVCKRRNATVDFIPSDLDPNAKKEQRGTSGMSDASLPKPHRFSCRLMLLIALAIPFLYVESLDDTFPTAWIATVNPVVDL